MAESLLRTPLHDLHARLGATIGPFAGWEMPIHYTGGIIAEHLQTRRSGGLFDVSHMGRFWVEGDRAREFLQAALTHDVSRVKAGTAQYNLIAMETGGTVDDCYLYRLGETTLLLVVNAANRLKDLEHLETIRRRDYADVEMEDRTAGLVMLALQGPETEAVLSEALGTMGLAGTLPKPGRNRVTAVTHPEGWEAWIARTGYTGEPVCFELFIPAEHGETFWTTLMKTRPGTVKPAGLGARNTLRSEAGLPLYGDELSAEISGLAAGLHSLAIRMIDAPAGFIGREALLEEYLGFPHRRIFGFVIEGRGRSPREGDVVYRGGEKIGVVTSATTIPYVTREVNEEKTGMRRIGFALLPSTCRAGFRSGADRRFGDAVEIRRAKGGGESVIGTAELVDRFTRLSEDKKSLVPVLFGDLPEEATEKHYTGKARSLAAGAAANHAWRQEQCINLIPSENTPSPFVRWMSELDPSGRYAEHNRVGLQEVYYYQGTDWIRRVEEELLKELRLIFGCRNAEVRPVSGQMANETVFEALVRYQTFRNRKISKSPKRLDRVFHHRLSLGGHLSSQPGGALYNYVAVDDDGTSHVTPFPVRDDYPYMIDLDALARLIDEQEPELLIFGKSMILEPEPIADARKMLEGLHPENRPLILYDMAHVLGLYGPHFQEPFAEGADIVTGSTHKTFAGPQRGLILSDLDEAFGRRRFLWKMIQRSAFPGATSNHHLGTLQGLLAAAYEFRAFGGAYQKAIIDNARAFARACAESGLQVEGDASRSYTQTHQVLLRVGPGKGIPVARALERNNIIVNFQGLPGDTSFLSSSGLRMGTQEMTRFGMDASGFGELAALMADLILRDRPVRDEVAALRSRYRTMRYTFPVPEAS
jgi:aminomethyltransferase